MDETLRALFEAYQERPIAYMPIYSRITGSVTAGILLSQIVYWDGKMRHQEFYKTDRDFCEELSMGTSELKNAKKRLLKMSLIGIVRRGIPAKTHYKLNLAKLSDVITTSVKMSTPVSRKTSNKTKQNRSTNTKTTTEITPDSSMYDAILSQNSSNDKDKVENYLTNNPSENDDVNNAIRYYLESYDNYMQNTHPPISAKQFTRVISTLESVASEYDLSYFAFITIINSWFADENVKSNYNIIHFATEGVIKTHYYKSVY